MGVRGDDLLPQGLGSPADEEEAPGNAVDDLPECVDAAHAAADRVPGDAPFDADPGVVPAEGFQRVELRAAGRIEYSGSVAAHGNGVFQRGLEAGLRGGSEPGRGFEAAEADAEAADLRGIFGPEAFELRAAQPQDLGRGGLFSGPGAIVGEVCGQGLLILGETLVFAAVVAQGEDKCSRDQHGVEDQVFFHGFRDLGYPER